MKLLQKLFCLIVGILIIQNFSYAQTFLNTPNDTINISGLMEDLETLSIQQVNTTNKTISLKWQKVSESLPAAWEASVCDNVTCYASLIDTGTMNPISPADYGLLLLHNTPHVNFGKALIQYEVWDINTPLLRDTLTYILTVSDALGIPEEKNKSVFTLFPNPAKETITISTNLQGGFCFSIKDITGMELERGICDCGKQSISTSNCSKGNYYISIMSKDKIISTKKIIVHQ